MNMLLRVILVMMITWNIPRDFYALTIAFIGVVGLSLLSHMEGYTSALEEKKDELK